MEEFGNKKTHCFERRSAGGQDLAFEGLWGATLREHGLF
jgi:hypothetical protein